MRSHSNLLFIAACLFGTVFLVSCSSSRHAKTMPAPQSSATPTSVGSLSASDYTKKLGVPVPENANMDLLFAILEWMHVPYKFGGNDKSGVDCSGLINQVYPKVYKVVVPRIAADIRQKAQPVSRSALREGDLVFFRINTKEVGHAGIYLFNDYFVHASTSRGVMISKLDDTYWNKYFVGGGRFSN